MTFKGETRLFCIVGPAGSGKSTVCNTLAQSFPDDTALSISTTTRPIRGSEVDGVHYHFVSKEEFRHRVNSGSFLEWAEFNGHLYGTEKKSIEDQLSGGRDILLDIEVQGVAQLKEIYKDRLITIFVFPPSIEILEKRLRARATDSDKDIKSRLKIAREEIKVLTSPGFSDYLITTSDKKQTASDAQAIYRAVKLKFQPGTGLQIN
jgi:guanylate kinase